MVSQVNSHTNATRIGWHLWDLPLGCLQGVSLREDGRDAEEHADGARHRLRLRRHRIQEVQLHPSRRMVSNASSSSSLLSLQVLEGP